MEHKVDLIATEGMFRGLAKQNMLCHQCICELVDNAIAAADGDRFHVKIRLLERSEGICDLYVSDNACGMQLEHLKKALQLGESATITNRLNEHGFGLKNALATLSGGNGPWKIWSKAKGQSGVCSVEGPFKPSMVIRDDDRFPDENNISLDVSTLIKVSVKISFLQTLRGRGAPTKNLALLRDWLVEHLGVLYRGYLEQDEDTCENNGVIEVYTDHESTRVPPISVPLGNAEVVYFDVPIQGKTYKIKYRYGTLDEYKRNTLVKGKKAKFYYQQNMHTQGIDIRLGKRVIATQQFETIWKTGDKQTQLSRHNDYNDFIGELTIPEMPRGVLTTVNTKTDFNLDDSDWNEIFDKLNEHKPKKDIRKTSESELRETWIGMLKATSSDDEIIDEMCVWPSGARIDVYRKTANGKIYIYEIKVGTGVPQHLYQLKMYWDGLIIDKNESPCEATLIVEDYDARLEDMANKMNKELIPPRNSGKYNFVISKLSDKGLISNDNRRIKTKR